MWCVIFICFKVFTLDMKEHSKNAVAFFQVFRSGGYDRCAYDQMCHEGSDHEHFLSVWRSDALDEEVLGKEMPLVLLEEGMVSSPVHIHGY